MRHGDTHDLLRDEIARVLELRPTGSRESIDDVGTDWLDRDLWCDRYVRLGHCKVKDKKKQRDRYNESSDHENHIRR